MLFLPANLAYTEKMKKCVKSIIRKVHTVFYVDEIVHDALIELRKKIVDERIVYFYVLDREHKLVGVVSTRALLLAAPNKKMTEIMEDQVISLHEEQTLEDSMHLFAKHKLLSLPVVNSENKFLGAIDVDIYVEKSCDLLNKEHRNDVFQFIGLTLEEQKSSVWRGYKDRIPWLFCNLLGGIGCAFISHIGQIILSHFLLLVMFIPLILSLSEAVSLQSMTQSLFFLKSANISWRNFLAKILKELKIVLFIAFTISSVVIVLTMIFAEKLPVSLTVGFTIAAAIVVAACFGIFIPLFLHRLKLDPKIASGPIVLMFSDIMATMIYLTLAALILL